MWSRAVTASRSAPWRNAGAAGSQWRSAFPNWDRARGERRADWHLARDCAPGTGRPQPAAAPPLDEAQQAQLLERLRHSTCTVVMIWPSDQYPLGRAVVIDGSAPDLPDNVWMRLIFKVGMYAPRAGQAAWQVQITAQGLMIAPIDEARALKLIAG